MHRQFRIALAAATLAAISWSAFAQADLTPQQRQDAYRATVKQPTSGPHRPPGFNPRVGETVPGSAPSYKFPDSLEDKKIHQYEYMVINNQMVLVDPATRRIVEIVK
jgi:hypothetical protein